MTVVETAVGRALVDRAREEGLNLEALALRLDLGSNDLAELLSGARAVDAPLAARLAKTFGGTPDEWASLDDPAPRVARWREALESFGLASLRALRDRGHVSATRKNPDRLAGELDAFFDCEPDECSQLVPASFRQSGAFAVRDDSVQVWLWLADLQAQFVAERDGVPTFDADELRVVLADLVQVGGDAPEDYLPRVLGRLAEAGVVVVFQPDVTGTRLFGASWPVPSGPAAVALTLRRRFDDFFWWTLYHECAHLLCGHGPVVDVHGAKFVADQEEEANVLARSMLVPVFAESARRGMSEDEVRADAERQSVPAGVLVGQLHWLELLEPWEMRDLQKAMPDAAELEVRPALKRQGGSVWDAAVHRLLRGADAP